MIVLLMLSISTVPLFLGVACPMLFGRTRLSIALLYFLACVSLWQIDVTVLYAYPALPTSVVNVLFRLFRVGQLFGVPNLFFVGYVATGLPHRWKNTRASKQVSRVGKTLVAVMYVWSTLVYALNWTSLGVTELHVVRHPDSPAFLYPTPGALGWLFHFHYLLYIAGLLYGAALTYRLRDTRVKEFMYMFLSASLLAFAIGMLNTSDKMTGLFASAIAVLLQAIVIFFGFIRAESQSIRYGSMHDELTGLPNRAAFLPQVRALLHKAEEAKHMVAVMVIDLDRFHNVNSALSHRVGDALLLEVAARLGTAAGTHPLFRLAGDEFAVVCMDEDGEELSSRILSDLRKPFRIHNHELHITASIGISLYPADGTTVENLLIRADSAMCLAKDASGDTVRPYTPTMRGLFSEKLMMENRLRRALEDRELFLQYQPKIDTATGRLTGAEALLRWDHHELGRISPADFIPVAEESGLIVPLGEWVLETAAKQCHEWLEMGLPVTRVSVNFSARQFRQRDLVRRIVNVLRSSGLNPDVLEIEITETVLMQNESTIMKMLQELKALGVSFSVDDFGTGYSSLSYLKELPIDILKLDQSFLRDFHAQSKNASIIRAVIALAHSLNLQVVAEGVETEDQLAFLQKERCDGAQGYYISRPLGAQAFQDLLRKEAAQDRWHPTAMR